MSDFRSGGFNNKTIGIQFDFELLAKAMEGYSNEVKITGLSRAMNRGGRAGGAKLISALAGQVGLKQNVIRKMVTQKKAYAGHLQYSYNAKAKATGLSPFGLTGKVGSPKGKGSYVVRANAWGEKLKTYHGAFLISRTPGAKRKAAALSRPKGQREVMEAFKRVKGSKGRFNVKMLYGPLIPYELVRADRPAHKAAQATMRDIAMNRLPHELWYAAEQAKAKAGLR